MEKHKSESCKVIENRRISSNTFLLTFKRLSDFIPGQMVKISLEPSLDSRLYSIASGIHDKNFSIIYNYVANGKLTPTLSTLKPGDRIYCSEAFGSFTDLPHKSIWIANGTGIAPFLSMIASGFSENKTLIRGARYAEDFYFDDIIRLSMNERYIRCSSSGAMKDSFHGRITDYLIQKQTIENTHYMLCGSAEMVVEVRDILITKGVSFTGISSEIYF